MKANQGNLKRWRHLADTFDITINKRIYKFYMIKFLRSLKFIEFLFFGDGLNNPIILYVDFTIVIKSVFSKKHKVVFKL